MTVIKRDGTKAEFDKNRIFAAIMKAAEATGEFKEPEARKITEIVTHYLGKSEKFKAEITVEEIQDVVEFALMSSGYWKTAKAYIVYREKRFQARSTKGAVIEVENAIREYLDQADWRVKENANLGYSLGGLIIRIAGKVVANYWLNYVYTEEIREAHKSGDIHIHDLDFFAGYCAGWSLRQLLEEGFNGVPGKVESKPAKHLETAVAQMVNFLGTLQNEWAGAQAFSSFDTYLAPFIKIDNLDASKVKQNIQQFVFSINTPSRWGTQTPFVNVTFDWVCPPDMKDKRPIIGGKELDFTYGDCQKEMDIINKAFIEVLVEGDMHGRIFTFPIPTYNITKDFNWEGENVKPLFEMTAKYGIPYFQNFVNSNLNPSDVRSMCCRLQLNLRELRARQGGLFGSAELTGSLGVVTLNLARVGYLSKTRKEFFERVSRLMDLAKQSLEMKRKLVAENMEKGLLPYTKRYLGSFNNHFSTIGINGMNEALLNFMDKDISDPEGKKFALEVLDFMRNKLSDYQEETGHIYNLEATPAEGATYRFAKEDLDRFPGIIQQGPKEAPYYTNSTHLPVGFTDDPLAVLDHQDELQTKYTGGTVTHLFFGESIPDWRACRDFAKKVANNYKLPYFTITPTFSVCHKDGYLNGEVAICPKCGSECEIWSRVVGYYRPVNHWNKGKQSEFKDRKEYKIPVLNQ
ncbi:MAG: ribonucleoside triphosphate reductase [Parcubacteria group bacterium]